MISTAADFSLASARIDGRSVSHTTVSKSAAQAQALRAQLDLGHGLLAARIDHRAAGAHVGGDLQEQRRLADARLTAQQDHRAGHDPATEHPVKLAVAGFEALAGGRRLRRALQRRAHRGGGRRARGAGRGALFERIPVTAQRALALPFEGFPPAGATDKHRIQAGHSCAFG